MAIGAGDLSRKLERWRWGVASALQRRVGPTFTKLHRQAWVIILVLAVVAIGLGTWRVLDGPRPDGMRPTIWDGLYAGLQLFALDAGAFHGPVDWRLNVARFLAPLVAAGTAVRALTMFFYDRMQLGMLRLFGRDHVIVCGLGRKGAMLVGDLRRRDEWVVVIESDAHNPGLERCRELGATIVIGSATNETVLRQARIERAKAIVSVTGSDAVNVETAVRAREMNGGRAYGRLRCVIHVLDLGLRRMLMESEIAVCEEDPFELAFFNAFEACAQAMLREAGWREAIAAPEARPHVVVVGLGQLGETIVVEAARDWVARSCETPLVVTVVDRHAKERWSSLPLQYPDLDPTCHFRLCEFDVRQPQFTSGGFLNEPVGAPPVTAVFVCLQEDAVGMYAGLVLAQLLSQERTPVVVRTVERAGLAAALRMPNSKHGFAENVRAVGLTELTCTAENLLRQMAPSASDAALLPSRSALGVEGGAALPSKTDT